MLRRKLSSGNPVVNYGLKTWIRWQTVDRAIGAPGLGDGLGINPSIYPDDAKDRDALFQSADARLYEAKKAGRNRVVSAPLTDPTARSAALRSS